MSQELNISDKLDFSDTDLTPPDKVISELLNKLPDSTKGMVHGKITEYDGQIVSYKTRGFPATLGIFQDSEVDIQDELGVIGNKEYKFECYLYTPTAEDYKYRLFFLQYNTSIYPATIVLEESIAECVLKQGGYITKCSKREQLEDFIVNIINSSRAVEVMQELIRIYKAHEYNSFNDSTEYNSKEDCTS